MKSSLWLLSLLLTVSALAGGKGFTDLSFNDALARAEKENKMVFVDFYTTWCGPCKMLDRSTWKDEKVTHWLKEHTVAVKIDAEVEVKLAAKYKVKSYPTLLFLKADGQVRKEAVGYMNADAFLSLGKDVLSGKDSLTLLREKLALDPADVMVRMELARELLKREQPEQALAAYKKMVEDMDSGDLSNQHMAYVYVMIARMKTDAATEFINGKRQALKARILDTKASSNEINVYAAASGALRLQGETLKLYDKMKAKGASAHYLGRFEMGVFDDMKEAHRYKELETLKPLKQRLGEVRGRFETMVKDPKMADSAKEYLRYELSICYEIALGLGQAKQADDLAQEVLGMDASSQTYNQLAWSAYSSGKANQGSLDLARKAHELSGRNDGNVIDTLARILAQVGQQKEAIGLLEDALAKPGKEGREKRTLQKCLKDLKAEAEAAQG